MAEDASISDVTQLLADWSGGDRTALERLLPIVYGELRALASRYLSLEGRGHTLQATALVNEAYLRLVSNQVEWKDRAHFFALASRQMRRILVDHARTRGRQKRGGGAGLLPLDTSALALDPHSIDILQVNEALDRLATLDSRKCEVVEMHFFGGLTNQEIAGVLWISANTVWRDLQFAKAWLRNELGAGSA